MRRLSLRGSAWGKKKGHTARNASDRQAADLLLMAKLCGAVTRSYTSRAVMSRRRKKKAKAIENEAHKTQGETGAGQAIAKGKTFYLLKSSIKATTSIDHNTNK